MAIVPNEIAAGMTFRVEIDLVEYPAPEWSLTLYLRGAVAIDFSSEADGSAHVLAAPGSTTQGWTAGRFSYQLRATDGDDVALIESGEVTIAPDLAAVPAGYDGRSHARRVLDAIEAVIEGRASKDQQSYQINNRSLSRTPIGDLLTLRDRYRAEVRIEAGGAAGIRGRNWKVRFT